MITHPKVKNNDKILYEVLWNMNSIKSETLRILKEYLPHIIKFINCLVELG